MQLFLPTFVDIYTQRITTERPREMHIVENKMHFKKYDETTPYIGKHKENCIFNWNQMELNIFHQSRTLLYL